MWRAEGMLPDGTFPVPLIFLNRLDAPLCVFNLGMELDSENFARVYHLPGF